MSQVWRKKEREGERKDGRKEGREEGRKKGRKNQDFPGEPMEEMRNLLKILFKMSVNVHKLTALFFIIFWVIGSIK